MPAPAGLRARSDCFCTELSAGRSVYVCGGAAPRADISIASEEAKSSIIVPFLVDGEYAGAVSFDTFRATREFDSAVTSALEIAASVIGAALQRERLLDTMRREREAAAEQRVAELARANAVLRSNLTRLASKPTEFFTNLLLETVRHAGAEAATAIMAGYDSDDWRVVCHVRDGATRDAEFAATMPGCGFGLHAADAGTAPAAAPAAGWRHHAARVAGADRLPHQCRASQPVRAAAAVRRAQHRRGGAGFRAARAA